MQRADVPSGRGFKGFSIRGRLLLFSLCISLIPITVITSVYYLNARNILKRQILEDLTAIAESKRVHVVSFMAAKKGRTTDSTSDEQIRHVLLKLRRGESLDKDTVSTLNRHLLTSKKPLDPYIEGIEIVDMDGMVVASTHEELIGQSMRGKSVAYKRAIDRNYTETCLGKPHYTPYLNANSICVAAPVTSPKGGEPLGVVINHYNMKLLDEITSNRAGMGETGEVVLGQKAEDKIVFLNALRYMPDAPFSLHVPSDSALAEPMKLALEGQSGTIIAPDYRDVNVLAVYQHIPSMGWGLVAKIDEAEAFAPLKTLGLVALIVGLVSAATVTVVGIIFATSSSRPIKGLAAATRKFTAGRLDQRVATTRQDEIGELARDFNVMAKTIEDHIATIKGDAKKIQTSRDRLNTVLGNMGCLVRVINPETHEVSLQNEPLKKLAPDGQKQPCYAFWERDKECDHCICREAIRDNEHKYQERVTLDGTIYEVHVFPLPNPDGTVESCIEVIRDVTARKKTEAQLEETRMQVLQAQKMAAIGSLSSGVAHSINNPLSGINMFSDVLLKKIEQVKDPELYKELKTGLTEIREAARRCESVTKDLLRISRMPKPEKTPVYINEILQHTLSVFVPQLKLLNIRLIEELSPAIPRVLGSHNQLETVFMNIISNAVDAMPGGGTLSVKSLYVPKDEKVQINITDTGSGITKQDLQYVMNPYFTTKPPGKGTGIGLSSAQLTIQSHRGTIEIESEVGRGTTVKVTLPVHKASPSGHGHGQEDAAV